MNGGELKFIEQLPGERRQVDCVEIYLPKTIKFLSELYQFLREKVTDRLGRTVLDGFSIYEVDAVFRGEELWEERTLVIRVLFIRSAEAPGLSVESKIKDIGRELATKIAFGEEQVWVCHYPQSLTIFPGLKKLLTKERNP